MSEEVSRGRDAAGGVRQFEEWGNERKAEKVGDLNTQRSMMKSKMI